MAQDKEPRDYLQRGVTHNIDEAAQRIFRSLLPVYWVQSTLEKDYGKDYHIEITEEGTGKVTGKVFYVQLKGVDGADFRFGNTVVAHEMELRHLTYFCDELKLPVFLVVVDIRTQVAYWLYVQEYLSSRPNWRKRKTFTLHIPVTDDLTDFPKFESEVERAIKHMRASSASVQDRLAVDVARGPVRISVSGEQGTSFANWLGHAALVEDSEVV